MSEDECTLSTSNCKAGIQASWVQGTATATVFAGSIAGQLIVRVYMAFVSINALPLMY